MKKFTPILLALASIAVLSFKQSNSSGKSDDVLSKNDIEILEIIQMVEMEGKRAYLLGKQLDISSVMTKLQLEFFANAARIKELLEKNMGLNSSSSEFWTQPYFCEAYSTRSILTVPAAY